MKINFKKIKKLYHRIIKKISPIEIAGGLFVSDSAIRYIRFNENGTVEQKASLRLPHGAVVDGKIIHNDIVVGALASLKGKITPAYSRCIEVVFSISSRSVYSQLFHLPQLKESSLLEAADLNIQMISPIDLKTAYYAYQVVGRPESSPTGGYELLGAFIKQSIIDEWISACKASGFLPIAIEFQTLSIVRAITDFAEIRETGIALAVDANSEGMNLVIIKNQNLYFDHFYSWDTLQGADKTISIEQFKQALIREIDKVTNFVLSKFGGEIKSIWISVEGIGDQIVLALKDQYPKLAVSEILIKGQKVPPLWLPVMGAAQRGSLIRSEDTFISLSPQSVITEHNDNQVLAMIYLWRKISTVVLCFFVFIFGVSNLFLRHIYNTTAQQSIRTLSSAELNELGSLQGQAKEFNSLVSFIDTARTQESQIYPFLSKIMSLRHDIQITRFLYADLSQPIVLNGSAPSSAAAAQFQKRLAEVPNITEIQMPLASLIATPGVGVTFAISFRITSLNF